MYLSKNDVQRERPSMELGSPSFRFEGKWNLFVDNACNIVNISCERIEYVVLSFAMCKTRKYSSYHYFHQMHSLGPMHWTDLGVHVIGSFVIEWTVNHLVVYVAQIEAAYGKTYNIKKNYRNKQVA